MKDKFLYIVDIRFKQKNIDFKDYMAINKNSQILSLTPYSNYLLDMVGYNYMNFHNVISNIEFNQKIEAKYKEIDKIIMLYKEYSFLFRDIAFVITMEEYLKTLFNFFDSMKERDYKLIYITDILGSESDSIGNINNFITRYYSFDNIINLVNNDKTFYSKNKYKLLYSRIFSTKQIVKKVMEKYILNKLNEAKYDNVHYIENYKVIKSKRISNQLNSRRFQEFSSKILETLNELKYNILLKNNYLNIINEFKDCLENFKGTLQMHPFVFLSDNKSYCEILYFKENNYSSVFMQHGSYLHENIFLKYSEIYPADINLVFNDFTKKLFEIRGAKKVYSVGSINFNYPIEDIKKEFDFVYIIYCGRYTYTGAYVADMNNTLSVDGDDIYQRHKKIIELFGTKFKDKKICIKIQPGNMTGDILYIPLLELSKNYPNITIEFAVSMKKIILKSKYIISDYFSSEFINRELHYKRDIILFKDLPYILTPETVEDMKKMFILVDTVDDLEEKIENIEKITKNRKRYDDIIEYYSSKKCDTKKVVSEILEKELNARN